MTSRVERTTGVRAPERLRRTRGRGRRLGWAVGVLALLVAAVATVGAWTEYGLPKEVAQRLYPLEYRDEIAQVALRFQVDPYLVAAVAKAESGFEPEVVSSAGAVGLMQLMPATATWIAGRDDWHGRSDPVLTDPEDNLALGTYYLAYLLGRFGGDVPTVLAAYNAGEGMVDEWLSGSGSGTATAGGAGGALQVEGILFPETRNFVERVERYRELFREVHPDAFAIAQ